MRRRKAWFNPYHARRSKIGRRRRSGESTGTEFDLEFDLGTIVSEVIND
jgi:hypothetical protein